MSVRATNSLIADLVTAVGIPNSPKMVVLSVNEEAKQVTTVWFSSSNKAQTAVFPAGALNRVDVATASAARKPAAGGPKRIQNAKKK
ncbi:MAG: hypothetical protein LBT01_08290 [Spirochaetaceae bacterium]|jgi:hypothetical protein|nr:hypothetical protein [Spirochaetaceae bacterium]